MLQQTNLSVLVATYNGEKYLSKQLDSILNQSIDVAEIIVVDDCSSDSTWSILQDYQSKHQNIKIYQNSQNLGCAKTFFNGLKYCSGDYIAFCDQDDIWLPNKLEVLLNNIGDNLLIHSDAKLIDELDNIIAESHFAYSKKHRDSLFTSQIFKCNVTGCTALISRKLLDYPVPEDFYIHDHYFALLATNLNKLKFIPDKLILYRQHSNNVYGANKFSYDKFIAHTKVVADSYSLLLDLPVFAPNYANIKLMRDYRLAFSSKKNLSLFNIMKLLFYPRGLSFVAYYFLVGGVLGKTFSEKFYNFIHRIK